MKICNANLLVELSAYLSAIDNAFSDIDSRAASFTAPLGLSSKSRDIEVAREVINSVDDLRREKVKTLKISIDDGSYFVDGDTIASCIIENALIEALL
jgi:anti-sigma28 factor (negative regulator of flagellin synthesis)